MKGSKSTEDEGSSRESSSARHAAVVTGIREVGNVAVGGEDSTLSGGALRIQGARDLICSGSGVDVVNGAPEDSANIVQVSRGRHKITNEVNKHIHNILALAVVLLNNESDDNDKLSRDRVGLFCERVTERTSVTRCGGAATSSGINSGASGGSRKERAGLSADARRGGIRSLADAHTEGARSRAVVRTTAKRAFRQGKAIAATKIVAGREALRGNVHSVKEVGGTARVARVGLAISARKSGARIH